MDDRPDEPVRAPLNLDDLKRRLDTPLFAREPGLGAGAALPHVRELTWEHVVNPTSSQPVITGDEEIGPDGEVRPKPISIDEILAKVPAPLAPSPLTTPAAGVPATAVPATDERVPATDRPDEPAAAPAPSTTPSGRVTALPSFASLMSGDQPVTNADTGTSPGWSGGLADEGLVKPIEERPPVARDTDPVVNGLAALIVGATPGAGVPEVPAGPEPVAEVPPPPAPPTTPSAPLPPVMAAPPDPAPAPPPPAPMAAAPSPPPPSASVPVIGSRVTGVHTAVGSAVEAELNRLAYLPDRIDDSDGPVDVPDIAYSDVRGAEPLVTGPVLSQGELYQPRPSAPAARHGYADLMTPSVATARRRKRHTARRILSLLVLIAMMAGGLFAVKYFVLDRVKWAAAVEPLAQEVETARGLTFQRSVDVVTLPAAEYASQLAGSLAGLTSTDADGLAAKWRAFGIATGTLDADGVGLTAASESPAFYDPTAQKIYLIEGLEPELSSFALHRALTMTLLDQHFHWGERLVDAAPTVVRGTLALYDADALATAQFLLPSTERAAVVAQLTELSTTLQAPAGATPLATVSAGRLGMALWPYLDTLSNTQRDSLERDAAPPDRVVFDLRRLIAGATSVAAPGAEGSLFWYHALASRVDDDLAWNVALQIQTDTVDADTPSPGCYTATVVVDESAGGAALMAFGGWAALAPEASKTTVTSTPAEGGVVRITLAACDPGVAATAAADAPATLSLGAAPLRAAQYQAAVEQLSRDGQPVVPAQIACAVYGSDPVTIADERALVDAAVPWPALAQHPAFDPATPGCTG